MKTRGRQKAFSYVLVSASEIAAGSAAGIGLIFKDDHRSTVTKVSQAFGDTTVEEATYEALRIALEEAIRLGVRAFSIYTDSPAVVGQLTQGTRVPPHLMGGHLRARALMNAVGSVQIKLAGSGGNFSARRLAQGATSVVSPNVKHQAPLQLQLLGDGAVA